MATGDNTANANLSTMAEDILQLAPLEQNGDATINDILDVTFGEVSPSSTNLVGIFSSDINDTARPTSFQVESQAVKHSFSGHGEARITSFSMNTKSHEDLSNSRANSGSDGKDSGASNVDTKKRRNKAVSTSESQDGRRCTCKVSRCLKLYCGCFQAGSYCHGLCSCESCYNTREYDDLVEDTVQQIETRNPLAFAPKVVNNCAGTKEEENSAISSSAKHRKGCNCKKSKCLKNYCECFQAKVGCSFGCRCEDCQNSFGMKTETARSERLKPPHQSSYATENRNQCMNTGNTNHLSANSHQFSSYAHQPLPWNAITDTSNLMPLSQPLHDETSPSSVRNCGRFTGEQIPEAYIRPTIDNSLPPNGYPNLSQFYGTKTLDQNFPNNVPNYVMNDNRVAHIIRDSGMPTNILRADSDIYISPSLHNRSDLPMSTSSLGFTRGQMPAVPSIPSVTPYVKYEDAAKYKGKENQRR